MNKNWRVDFDRSSRPILLGPKSQMLSMDKFISGRWHSFRDEEEILGLLADKLNEVGYVGEHE